VSVGPLQLLLIVVLVILLFGTKKLGNIGSDLGKAIRDFKKGMSDDGDASGHGKADSLKPDPPDAAQPGHENSSKSSDRPDH
jgi:sec-independent protein translocase protein TatA